MKRGDFVDVLYYDRNSPFKDENWGQTQPPTNCLVLKVYGPDASGFGFATVQTERLFQFDIELERLAPHVSLAESR